MNDLNVRHKEKWDIAVSVKITPSVTVQQKDAGHGPVHGGINVKKKAEDGLSVCTSIT